MDDPKHEEEASGLENEEEGDEDMEEAYERERQRNIAANQAKLLELGLLNSTHRLFGDGTVVRRRHWRTAAPPRPASRRRSSRLQGQEAKHYADELPRYERSSPSTSKKVSHLRRSLRTAGYCQEEYGPEHLLLLGTCNTPYPRLYEKKIYDQARGTTCHQCRQKTIDKKTTCSRCQSIAGQFCGTCLQERYGENVEETWAKPDWVCPVCRDVCNCSICRPAKGWAPTGMLAPKAKKAGYESVAHYLITIHQREHEEDAGDDHHDPKSIEGEEEKEGGQGVGLKKGEEPSKRNEGSDTLKRKGDETADGSDDLHVSPAEVRYVAGRPTDKNADQKKSRRRKAGHTAATADEGAPRGILSYFEAKDHHQQEEETRRKRQKTTRQEAGKDDYDGEGEEEGGEEEAIPHVNPRELKKGTVVACWADPSTGDQYWLARVTRGCSGRSKASTVRIRWFEQLPKKKDQYREGQEDVLAANTIFHILSGDNFVKVGPNRWRLDEDLRAYDPDS